MYPDHRMTYRETRPRSQGNKPNMKLIRQEKGTKTEERGVVSLFFLFESNAMTPDIEFFYRNNTI